ncbi:MAG: hypothetical protein ABIJ20_03245 [Nanoarchaeota archaeon]|nr:hypothetical protein [Nanoarchaeota archaeon]
MKKFIDYFVGTISFLYLGYLILLNYIIFSVTNSYYTPSGIKIRFMLPILAIFISLIIIKELKGVKSIFKYLLFTFIKFLRNMALVFLGVIFFYFALGKSLNELLIIKCCPAILRESPNELLSLVHFFDWRGFFTLIIILTLLALFAFLDHLRIILKKNSLD